MRDFRELKVWHKAHQVALEVYRQSRDFPTDERFGLTAHLRKSATSVAISTGWSSGGPVHANRSNWPEIKKRWPPISSWPAAKSASSTWAAPAKSRWPAQPTRWLNETDCTLAGALKRRSLKASRLITRLIFTSLAPRRTPAAPPATSPSTAPNPSIWVATPTLTNAPSINTSTPMGSKVAN